MDHKKICEYLNEISKNKIKLVFFEKMTGSSPHWNYNKHSHKYLEIIFFLSGNIRINVDDDNIIVSTYNVLFYPPNVEHHELPNSHQNPEVIALGIEVSDSIYINKSFKTNDTDNIFKFLFEQILEKCTSDLPESDTLCRLYIEAILLNAYQHFYNYSMHNYDIVDLLSQYICNNFQNYITINQLANLAVVSPSYLNRVFSKKMNITPIRYLNKIRIQVAKQLLCSTGLTINEISIRTGFTSESYFWRMFKRSTNISPTEYRIINKYEN